MNYKIILNCILILIINMNILNSLSRKKMTQSTSIELIKNDKQKLMPISNSLDDIRKKEELLGQGGSGKVTSRRHSNLAIKRYMSPIPIFQKIEFRSSNVEYEILTKVYESFLTTEDNLTDMNLTRYIIIPEPIESKVIDEYESSIKMQRLFPIHGEEIITQLYLGETSIDITQISDEMNMKKARVIGYQETKKILKSYKKKKHGITNIKELFKSLGHLLAILHYGSKYDGKDGEICLCRPSKEHKECKISLIDYGFFGNLEKILIKNPEKAIKKIIYAMVDVEPFYPDPDKKEFSVFYYSYIKMSETFGFKKIAENIMSKFIIKQFLEKKLIRNILVQKFKLNKKRTKQLNRYSKIIGEKIYKDFLEILFKKNLYIKYKKAYKLTLKLISKYSKELDYKNPLENNILNLLTEYC